MCSYKCPLSYNRVEGEAVLLADCAGLYLRKQTSAGTTWTFRYRFGGRGTQSSVPKTCVFRR